MLKRIVRSVAPKSRLQAAVLSAVVVGSLTAGVSYASIPDASGVIHGCYSKSGALKIIDTAKKPSCAKGTTSLNWSQSSTDTGPSGLESFSTSGSWVAPAGVTGVKVIAVGGDGGGGPVLGNCGGRPYLGQAGAAGGYVETVMGVFPGDHYAVTVGTGGAAAPVATGLASGSSGTASMINEPDGTELVRAGGGAGGAYDDSCHQPPPPPPPAAAGGGYSAFGGLVIPNGSCKALMIRVDPCGQGGTAATNQIYMPPPNVTTPAGPGDDGQVILEW